MRKRITPDLPPAPALPQNPSSASPGSLPAATAAAPGAGGRTFAAGAREVLGLPGLLPILFLAFAVRLVLMAGRGAFIGFDEGYYLLLAKSLWNGGGFTLNGLPHTTFSPLYPFLVGGLDRLLGDIVWSGRLVSAAASALLVVPVYLLARQLFWVKAAPLAALLVAIMPSLTAFVPFWSGRELYVGGSEPLFHLCLFSALVVLAHGSRTRAALAGALMGLGFLARTEAFVLGALLAAVAAWPTGGIRPAMVRGSLYLVAFLAVSSAHLGYMRQVSGHWTLSGRAASVQESVADVAKGGGAISGASTESGEAAAVNLLWGGSELAHIRGLYSLDRSGARLSNRYWGVYQEANQAPALEPWEALPAPAVARKQQVAEPGRIPSRPVLYFRTMGIIFPVVLWVLALTGAVAPPARRRRSFEALLAGSLVLTSVAIAALVHVDPRNHLFLTPLLAIYAAAGAATVVDRLPFLSSRHARLCLLALVIAVPAGVTAKRAGMGLLLPSPQHVAGIANREAGALLAREVPAGEPIMAWHPAIALYAGRDWRVLPYEPLPQVLHYAAANDIRHAVFAVLYPAPVNLEESADYVLFRLPAEYRVGEALEVEWERPAGRGERLAVGRILTTR